MLSARVPARRTLHLYTPLRVLWYGPPRAMAAPGSRPLGAPGSLPLSFEGLGGENHPIFAKYGSSIELRTGRPCQVLCARPEASTSRAGDTIFFIHGAMASMTQFEFQCSHYLERGFTVVAFDSVGANRAHRAKTF